MSLAADGQRERALASLRHHYLQGRLDADELAARAERAVCARTTADLRAALRDLPRIGEVLERARETAYLVGYLVLLAGAWVLASLFLVAALAVLAIAADSPLPALLAVSLWIALTCATILLGMRRVRRR